MEDQKDIGELLRSAYEYDPLQKMAWSGCLLWAIKNDKVLDHFVKDTGYSGPKSGLEMMIDEATGFDKVVVEQFVHWFNDHVWGDNPWNNKLKDPVF